MWTKCWPVATVSAVAGRALPPAGTAPADEEALARVLLEVAERLQDNFPYFHPLYAGQMLKPPHPVARLALKILGVRTAQELAEVIVAVGLAQNLAALRALAAEGIQRGHMALHARQLAIAAGAPPEMVDDVVARMVAEKVVRLDRAQEIVKELTCRS
jgi:hypothetical protein